MKYDAEKAARELKEAKDKKLKKMEAAKKAKGGLGQCDTRYQDVHRSYPPVQYSAEVFHLAT
jgi:hypothetical protein